MSAQQPHEPHFTFRLPRTALRNAAIAFGVGLLLSVLLRALRPGQRRAVGHVLVFLSGEGDMVFEDGRRDRSHRVSLITPSTRAASIEVKGPFHCIGAALSPLGWAAF